MRANNLEPIRLKDYRPPDFLIDTVELDINLHPTATRVKAQLTIRRNPSAPEDAPLVLDGDGLSATSLALNGEALDLELARPDGLTIARPPRDAFSLTVETTVNPSENTQLMGLYKSGGVYCTQCEAEGFRRITYFLDRPDVLSVYTTRIEGPAEETPVLLGNGNLIESGATEGGTRRYAVWRDPYPKPCYLFAIVGGDLGSVTESFVTMSGRAVELGVYVERGKEERARYAMDALKRAMRWDEQKFGREYDLDIFNLVAVSTFNMGAMENKGLNIFNDKYVLASPETATDGDYAGIETVVAHEYFHNWTGNRITCRDWFQLCLKEGLTVFRDQEFSADERSRAVKRIADIRVLRSRQFPEDAGPLAHNVRPDAYYEINNFYTPTVYEKGAELVRVLQSVISQDAFRRGMDLYFSRFDGAAATIEDFLSCFAESSGRDLTHFKLWYEQAGTPVLRVKTRHNEQDQTFTIEFTQWTPATPGQTEKRPVMIPIALGLIGPDGSELPLITKDVTEPDGASAEEASRGVFLLTGEHRVIVFRDVPAAPTPSLLRGFSAPVRLEADLADCDLLHLLAHDRDPVNRWEAAQTYATRLLVRAVDAIRRDEPGVDDTGFIAAIGAALEASLDDPAFAAQIAMLPSEADIARDIGVDVDPDAIHKSRNRLRRRMGASLKDLLLDLRARMATPSYAPDAAGAGRRALRNAALDLLAASDREHGLSLARDQFNQADNMTDRAAALGVLSLIPGNVRERAFDAYYVAYKDEPLVIDKWLAMQAAIPESDVLQRVRALLSHEAFSLTNPNRLRALIGTFANANPTQFNAPEGYGYDFVAEIALQVDSRNPQAAARLMNAFGSWKRLEMKRRAKAEEALRRVANNLSLSPDLRDIVDRSLA